MKLKSIFPTYYKVKAGINHYVNENIVAQKTIRNTSMDVSNVDKVMSKVNDALKKDSGLGCTFEYTLSQPGFQNKTLNDVWSSSNANIVYDLWQNDKFQGLQIKQNDSGNYETHCVVTLNSNPIASEFLTNNIWGNGSTLSTLVYSDTSVLNNEIILSDLTKYTRDNFYNTPTASADKSIEGHYSLLPAQEEKLRNADRDFMNSILSLAVYTGNDSWTSYINEKRASGEILKTNDVLGNHSLFPNANDLDKVVASYYATNFSPAKVMPNGKFEAPMGNGVLGDFEFKDGVYRSNDNVCSAAAMMSRNEARDGEEATYTLHMAYRGTDNASRKNGDYSDLEKRHPTIKAFNSIVRFARYCVTAYSDMGKHHENFTPFEKACLEFAANPDNKISKIEVSGHSLGGAMVQRFLKSDELLNSSFKDKVQGMTWGAPQTNANMLGKVLVAGKRVVESAVVGTREVIAKSYIEYITSSTKNDEDLRKYQEDPVKNNVAKVLFAPLVLTNLVVAVVPGVVPNAHKIAKNLAGFTYSFGKRTINSAIDVLDNFESDVNSTLNLFKENRDLKRATMGVSGEKFALRNKLVDILCFVPDQMAAIASAVPRSVGPITRAIKKIWDDLGDADIPEQKLRQYAHHKDPIPVITKLLASNVGIKKKLENYVDTIPVWQQAVKDWDADLNQKITHKSVSPEVKEYTLVEGLSKAVSISLSNAVGYLSTDKHNMRKYVINTMMRESLFRRTNIHSENDRFSTHSVSDKKWLENTPNITSFELLLHSTRLENTIIEDAMNGTQFRDNRDLYARKLGYYDLSDSVNSVSVHMNKVVNKLESLYGGELACVSKDYDRVRDFSSTANEMPLIQYGVHRNLQEKIEDASEALAARRRSDLLAKKLEEAIKDMANGNSIESKNPEVSTSLMVSNNTPKLTINIPKSLTELSEGKKEKILPGALTINKDLILSTTDANGVSVNIKYK